MVSEDIVRKFHQKRGRIRIPDPGGKKASDPGSGSATLLKGKKPYKLRANFDRIHIDLLG
jgi:hypothetical protein